MEVVPVYQNEEEHENRQRRGSMDSRRRSSISTGIFKLSRSMSAGLTFVQKKVRQGSYLEFHETDICIDLCQLEQYQYRNCQVVKINVCRFNFCTEESETGKLPRVP